MTRALQALLPQGRLKRAVVVLMSGTAFGQLLLLIASPLLTRLYTPEDFGVLGVFSALLMLFGIAVCLRYEVAIPLAEDDARMANLLALSLALAFLVSALIGVALWLSGEMITRWLNTEALRPFLWLLPVGLLGVGCNRALTHWAIRRQEFGQITRTEISRSVGQVTTQLGCGYLALGPVGLLAGQIIGQSAGVTTLALAFHRRDGARWRSVRLRDMARAAARFANFPTYSAAAALLSNAGRYAPALFVAALYGAEAAGWFALARRILATPVFLSNAVARVYLSEAPRRARGDGAGVYRLFKRTTWRLLIFGVLALGLVVVAGPQLFALVFGAVWTEAGRYAQFLALVTLGQLVVAPVAHTLTVLERQDLQLVCDALLFAALLLIFFTAHQLAWPPLLTIAVLSTGMTLCYVLLFVLTRRVLLAHTRERTRTGLA
jgi:O-antigen/teichoic acid export membrane protein